MFETDYYVLLMILKLHQGKSIFYQDGILIDKLDENYTTINNVIELIKKEGKFSFNLEEIESSISRLVLKQFIVIKENKICPKIGLIQFFVEILQYSDSNGKQIKMLKSFMCSILT